MGKFPFPQGNFSHQKLEKEEKGSKTKYDLLCLLRHFINIPQRTRTPFGRRIWS